MCESNVRLWENERNCISKNEKQTLKQIKLDPEWRVIPETRDFRHKVNENENKQANWFHRDLFCAGASSVTLIGDAKFH